MPIIGSFAISDYLWATLTPAQQASFSTTWSTTTATGGTTAPIVFGTPSTVAPPDAISIVTGIDPNEVAAATYGKIIPVWVGGMPRLGCHIIFGPTFTSSGGITYASFGVSFGMPANNLSITRELRELRLDGYKVWSLAEGYLMTGLTFRFYSGSEIQTADPLVTAAYPAAPVAHRGHCCVFIENLALTDFNLKVPFVSAVIADPESITWDDNGAVTSSVVDPADGVNLGDALMVLAYSPYINLASANAYSYGHRTTADFITEGISERVDALIVAENVSFLDLINRFARLHLWDIVQRDKLMAIERGSVSPDITLDLTDIVAASDAPPILIERSGPSDRPRELEYSYIDVNRDYEINSVTSKQMSIPGPATASEGKDTIALPVVHTIQEAMSWVTLRNFKDAIASESISFTTSIVGYEIEPGDIIRVDAGFKTYTIRVIESMKGANWTNRIRGEPVLRCAPSLSFEEPGTPASLYLWLKGDELAGSEGSDITTWPDDSGNNFDFTAIVGEKPSLDVDGLNDLNVVHFGGNVSVAEKFTGPDMSGPTAGTLFYVIRAAADPNTGIFNGGVYLSTAAAGPHFPHTDGHIYCGDLRGGRIDLGDPATPLTIFNLISIVSSATEWSYYINGVLFYTTATNTCTWPTGPELGAVGLFLSWTGDIAEVVGHSVALTTPQRQQVEGYLAHKWGLTDLLDATHPYKSTPP